jgi:hypothetical protein
VTWIFCAFRAWSALDFRVFVDCQFTADATVVRRHPVHRVPYLEYCSFVPFVFWFIDKMISDFLFAVPLWGNLRVANWCVAAHQSSETRVADAVTVAKPFALGVVTAAVAAVTAVVAAATAATAATAAATAAVTAASAATAATTAAAATAATAPTAVTTAAAAASAAASATAAASAAASAAVVSVASAAFVAVANASA